MQYRKYKKLTMKKAVLPFMDCLLYPVQKFLYKQNHTIVTTGYKITHRKIPANFRGYKVVHLTDLHNMRFGEAQEPLIDKIRRIQPNIIVVTGDSIDSRRTDFAPVFELMKELVKIVPVYYIRGNHEARIDGYYRMEKELIDIGIRVLRNETVRIHRGTESILLTGVDDIMFNIDENIHYPKKSKERNEKSFSILLSHRPTLFEEYEEKGYDLVFSGHEHGGQIRLPCIGGIISPSQGFFPKYSEGVHRYKEMKFIISRGLGNSLFPYRVFNKPEIVVATFIS